MVISSAVKADNPEVLEAHKRKIPVIPARGNACRTDAPEIRHCRCRSAWKNHHHFHGRLDPGRGSPRSHVRRRRPRQSGRHHRARWQGRIFRRGSRRERPQFPDVRPGSRSRHHHRPRASRSVRLARRHPVARFCNSSTACPSTAPQSFASTSRMSRPSFPT